jgi:hypothetical protein
MLRPLGTHGTAMSAQRAVFLLRLECIGRSMDRRFPGVLAACVASRQKRKDARTRSLCLAGSLLRPLPLRVFAFPGTRVKDRQIPGRAAA